RTWDSRSRPTSTPRPSGRIKTRNGSQCFTRNRRRNTNGRVRGSDATSLLSIYRSVLPQERHSILFDGGHGRRLHVTQRHPDDNHDDRANQVVPEKGNGGKPEGHRQHGG